MQTNTVSETIKKQIEESYQISLNDENVLMETITKNLGGTCYQSTKEEDMFKHIDVWWETPEGEKVGIDVKGIKKSKRVDRNFDDSIHWIEILNVNGNPGWIYGEAKYIAFMTKRDILFVETKDLPPFVESKTRGKNIVTDTPRDFYVPYTRSKWGRNDVTIKVPTSDLESMAKFKLEYS